MLRISLLIVALLLQVTIVTVMIVKAVMPIWNGRETLFMAQPVDPRDIMRGDYVALNYEFNSILPHRMKTDLAPGSVVRGNEYLFVTIRMSDTGAVPTGIFRSTPVGEQFIKGRSGQTQIVPETDQDASYHAIDMSYGIEEFYTDSETAQALDDELQKGKKIPVVVMIDAEGNARIRSVARASQTPHSK